MGSPTPDTTGPVSEGERKATEGTGAQTINEACQNYAEHGEVLRLTADIARLFNAARESVPATALANAEARLRNLSRAVERHQTRHENLQDEEGIEEALAQPTESQLPGIQARIDFDLWEEARALLASFPSASTEGEHQSAVDEDVDRIHRSIDRHASTERGDG